MSDRMFRCGDHDALVSYLYEEGEPLERAMVRTHLADCARCADEVRALGETRQQLMAWAPPAVDPGVRVSAAAGAGAAPPLVRGRWWAQPLPAWAQVAAAGLIFAAGISVGSTRTAGEVTVHHGAPVVTEAVPPPAAADLVAIEERLHAGLDARVRAVVGSEMAARQSAPVSAPPAPAFDVAALLREVDARIARSDDRRRLELATSLQTLHRGFRTLELQQRAAMDDLQDQRATLARLAERGEAIALMALR